MILPCRKSARTIIRSDRATNGEWGFGRRIEKDGRRKPLSGTPKPLVYTFSRKSIISLDVPRTRCHVRTDRRNSTDGGRKRNPFPKNGRSIYGETELISLPLLFHPPLPILPNIFHARYTCKPSELFNSTPFRT